MIHFLFWWGRVKLTTIYCCDHPISSLSVFISDNAHWLLRPLSLSPLARGANLFGLGVT